MTLAEDLLLIAVDPRDGLIRSVERIGIALRTMELVELAQAGRIAVDGRRIVLLDPAPLGHPRLDRALAALRDGSRSPALDAWFGQPRDEPGLINQYLALLAGQGAVRAEYRYLIPAMLTSIVVLDRQRCVRARTAIDGLARGRRAAGTGAGDRALAVVVHTCGLDRYLYRGLRGRSARNRLARLTGRRQLTDDGHGGVDAAVGGIAGLTDDLPALMHRAYRLQQIEHATERILGPGRPTADAGARDGRSVRIVEADGYTTRHAVLTMRRPDTPLRFVLIPMAHVALPGFYEQVRSRLDSCDLIIAEGIRGKTWQVNTLTMAYRLAAYRRRHGLMLQDRKTLLPPGVPVVNPDVTAAEATRDLRALGRQFYLLLMITAPLVGLYLAIRGPRAFLQLNIDATQPSTMQSSTDSGEDMLMPDHDPDPDPDPIGQALRARRDRRLVEAIDTVYDEHHDEPLTVAVVYGAAHIPAVYVHLFARHRYRPGEPEWITALSIPGDWI